MSKTTFVSARRKIELDAERRAGALDILMVDSHHVIQRGGAVQCAALARTLAQRGHRVTCIFDRRPGPTASNSAFAALADAGVELVTLRLWSPLGMWRLRRWMRRERPDIIHTHKNRALRFVFLTTLGLRRPPWVANRGTVYALTRHRFAAWIHQHRVDRILAVSNAVRESLLTDGVSGDRVHTVYGSVDPDRFDPSLPGKPFRDLLGIPPGAPVVGMLASLTTPKKGHGLLLQVVHALRGRYADLRVVFAGDGDPGPLRARTRALGLEGHVYFPGFVDDPPSALAAFDVLVCASLQGEGLTGAVREALAMARPVVSTSGAGNAELVIDGVTGRLVPPGDAEALAEAIDDLLRNPRRARGMAEAGRARVLARCTDDIRADQVEGIYRQLCRPQAALSAPEPQGPDTELDARPGP